ncbi:Adenine phosphoribosyltransferase 4 [Capsicum chinense]|nr:Adenine phosphoribosyltransferase 4 [Capsicum chinense]
MFSLKWGTSKSSLLTLMEYNDKNIFEVRLKEMKSTLTTHLVEDVVISEVIETVKQHVKDAKLPDIEHAEEKNLDFEMDNDLPGSYDCFMTSYTSYVKEIEARGFIFGQLIALAIGAKFVPLRKPKKLPGKIEPNCLAKRYVVGVHRIRDAERLHNSNEQLSWVGSEIEFTISNV